MDRSIKAPIDDRVPFSMPSFRTRFFRPHAHRPQLFHPHWLVTCTALLAFGDGSLALADAPPQLTLTLKDHHFTPDHLSVASGQRFRIMLQNLDDTTDEFESYDMKFEKIIVHGDTITVKAGPLHPGTYKFFDDYHPDSAVGTITASEAK